MAFASVADFVDALQRFELLEPEWDDVTRTLQLRYHDPRTLARELLKRNWLTAYQINQLYSGNGQELVVGSYRILERLGEGGMGKVFKAWHRKLDRLVALKVLHKECLQKPQAVQRFYQEIQLAARMSHPNIVFAFDADQINDTYFLAMEYVDGIGLGRLVEQSGPLSVLQACDYMKQAADGLQHAHERGLVHRDIKPSNLLVTKGPAPLVHASGGDGEAALPAIRPAMIKVIDFGLARLEPHGHHAEERRITRIGTVMGTPDFISPEQVADTHAADTRSDLYSLGCTFYYLLTGRVPFPGGALIDKLRRHESSEPLAVEKVRSEVPARLGGVIRKLMAKKPEQRYQTPQALADDLEGFLQAGIKLGAPRLAGNSAPLVGDGLSSTTIYNLMR